MGRLIKIFGIIIVLAFISNGCAVNSIIYGSEEERENYTLIEYFENPDSSANIKVDDILIVTEPRGWRYLGKVLWVSDNQNDQFDFQIEYEKTKKSFRYSDLEHIQVIEYSEYESCLINGLNLVDDVARGTIIAILLAIVVLGFSTMNVS
jgi:hypothetical protein